MHETQRNQKLIASLTDESAARPRLYPSTADFHAVKHLMNGKYITIAPGSVWFTKTFPPYKWAELIVEVQKKYPELKIFLIGSPDEKKLCEEISASTPDKNISILSGQLTLLQSAALMSRARMNYTNDSAPLHLASAMNAPVTAIYCSTVPEFGFGPLSDESHIVQTRLLLECKPCGLHGYKSCPLVHFKCAHSIEISDLLNLKITGDGN